MPLQDHLPIFYTPRKKNCLKIENKSTPMKIDLNYLVAFFHNFTVEAFEVDKTETITFKNYLETTRPISH